MEDDTKKERQRRLQRQISDRFEKSHVLRSEQDRIEKRMTELEQEFQDCQNKLRNVKADIADIETFVLDDEYQDIALNSQRADQRLDSHHPVLEKAAEANPTITVIDDEDIFVQRRESHTKATNLRVEDDIHPSNDDDEEHFALGLKLKEEIETDSEYEDEDDEDDHDELEDDLDNARVTSSRERKRRRLHVLPMSDDDDEYVP